MELVHKNLVLPNNGKKLLLHTCCAPCSGSIILSIQASGIDFTIFFYNPNIHPKKEYEIRKDENIRFAEKTFVMGRRFRLLPALRVTPYLRRMPVSTVMRGKTLLRRGFKVV